MDYEVVENWPRENTIAQQMGSSLLANPPPLEKDLAWRDGLGWMPHGDYIISSFEVLREKRLFVIPLAAEKGCWRRESIERSRRRLLK